MVHRAGFVGRMGPPQGGDSSIVILDLTARSVPSYTTFTRASQATDFNSAGVLTTEGNNVARFDFNPLTLQPRGLLVEGARTNLCLQSVNISTGPWGNTGVFTVNNSVGALDGGLSRSINTSAAGVAGVFQSITVVANTAYTLSGYVKEVSGAQNIEVGSDSTAFVGAGKASIVMNPSTGAFVSQNAGVQSYTITSINNGWYRWTITCTTGAAQTSFAVILYNVGTGTREVAYWGNQVEAGTFPSSYIPTTGAAATRAADVATIPSLASIGFNPLEGTILVEAECGGSSNAGASTIFSINDTTANNRIQLRRFDTASAQRFSFANVFNTTAVPATDSANGTWLPNTVVKMAGAYSTGNTGAAFAGVDLGSQTTAFSGQSFTRAQIGAGINDAAGDAIWWIRRIVYYPTRLSNAQIQALTV